MTDLATEIDELRPRICVIGVGGAGGNAVANMIESGVCGVEFIAVNTDAQALRHSPAHQVVQLGRAMTQGLGAGSRAEIGKTAAEESLADIEEILNGAHMCFIAAGMGGGTGSGAAPVIAKAARDRGILTVGVVTKPFAFEGTRRARTAELGLEELRRHVDTLIVIPNQNLFRIASVDMSFKAAFALADDVLQKGVRGITDLMTMPGLINLDFADIRTIMANTGSAMLGVGEASGEHRAMRAAEQAIANPLLDDAMKGATGLIISITGGDDIGLWEIDEIAGLVGGIADPDADIIWGSAFDQSLAGTIRVSVVATGLDLHAAASAAPAVPTSLPGPSRVSVAGISPATLPLTQQEPLELWTEPRGSLPSEIRPRDNAPEPGEHRSLLAPPPGAMAFTTIEPFAVEQAGDPEPSLVKDAPTPGRTLFERMAMMAQGGANGAGDSRAGSDPYREPGHRSIARQAA